MDNFRNKFKIEELLLTKVGGWSVSLRPEQVTLGSIILSLDRPCPTLAGITPQEGEELSGIFGIIEQLFRATFKPNKINYLALMMVDHQVHFHVIPRYQSSVFFEAVEYQDLSWPGPPNLLKNIQLSRSDIQNIYLHLKSNL